MSETEQAADLEQVRFTVPILGPTGRAVTTLGHKAVSALYLLDDMVCWEKGDTRVYIPLSNVSCFTVR